MKKNNFKMIIVVSEEKFCDINNQNVSRFFRHQINFLKNQSLTCWKNSDGILVNTVRILSFKSPKSVDSVIKT